MRLRPKSSDHVADEMSVNIAVLVLLVLSVPVAGVLGPSEKAGTVPATSRGSEPKVHSDRYADFVRERRAEADDAIDAGDVPRALRAWERLLRVAPGDTVARDAIHNHAARPPLRASAARDETRALLPARFRVTETEHYVLMSDTDPAVTRAYGRRLEATRRAFTAFTSRLGLDTLPVRHRLVCVIFKHRRDFERFAARHDDVRVGWCQGYYTPRHDRVVLFDHEHAPDADAFARPRAIAATVHEATHQLAFHVHVQNPAVHAPLWVTEGLATSFETDDTARSFGPWEPFEPRVRRVARLVADDAMLPLRDLVTLDRLPDGRPETIDRVYGQCYAVFAYVVTRHPTAMRTYLESLRREPPGTIETERLLVLFEAAFGSVDALDQRWQRHLARLEASLDALPPEDRTRTHLAILPLTGPLADIPSDALDGPAVRDLGTPDRKDPR